MWVGNEYYYSVRTLKAIAEHYESIYDGIQLRTYDVTNPWAIAEYKADFDRALDNLGRGHWTGNIEKGELRDFRGFGRLQRVVIGHIYGLTNYDLERLGYKDVARLSGMAYAYMRNYINMGYLQS